MECSEVFHEIIRVPLDMHSQGFQFHLEEIQGLMECLHQVLWIYRVRNNNLWKINIFFLHWSIVVSSQTVEPCSL